MFLNFSNHPVERWDENQIKEAKKWGEIVDYPFPNVDSKFDEAQIEVVINNIVNDIVEMKPDIVMCQGEFTVAFGVVSNLKKRGIPVVAACSERCVSELAQEDGSVKKIIQFKFTRFRQYI